MSSLAPKLLLVANASDVALVFEALEQARLPQPALGIGGDETLELFERTEPDVVLMVAGVDQGDLPSLVSAIRSGHYGRPAPVVLIASADHSVRTPADAADIHFDHFVSRPFTGAELADAIRRSGRDATGARIQAAMELAIESFVADAMGSLLGEPALALAMPPGGSAHAKAERAVEPSGNAAAEPSVDAAAEPSGDAAAESPYEPPAEPPRQGTELIPAARDETAVLQTKKREPTQVLGAKAGELAVIAPVDSTSLEYRLNRASRELLDEVLPNETLDVDIDELDGLVDEAPAIDDEVEGSEPGGGDFARQLRLKMSAMAERLFPGQRADANTAHIAPPNTAHTEIDLREIVEGPDEESSSAASVATHSLVNESGVTLQRREGHGLEGAARAAELGGQALVGDIDATANDVATIVGQFWRSEFSGRVVFRCDDEEKRIEFEKGSVVFASSDTSDDRMGQLLLREGKINEEQLADCRRQVSASGRRMGEILVDLGFLKPRELLPAVRQHLEDICYSLFAWSAGTYDAMPEHAIEERIRLSRHPAALIVEGIRRKYDEERLEACLGDKNTIVLAARGEALSTVMGATELSSAENKAIAIFDGEHTLEDVSQQIGLQPLRVAQLAHAMVCLGLAEIVETSTDEGADRLKAKAHLVGETDLEIDRKRVLAKHQLVQEADYFQLLGVRPDASGFEIRRAYEAAVRYFCAESFPIELQEELAEVLEEISDVMDEAFAVLSDDRVRNRYRANLQ